MCELWYSPRCPVYASGLRRPPQRKLRRRVCLLCHERAGKRALSMGAFPSLSFQFSRDWAWGGVRAVSWHSWGVARGCAIGMGLGMLHSAYRLLSYNRVTLLLV